MKTSRIALLSVVLTALAAVGLHAAEGTQAKDDCCSKDGSSCCSADSACCKK